MHCLSALYQNISKNLHHEIILVDNASVDNSVSLVKNNFPEVKIIQNSDNIGFGNAANKVIHIAKGEYILFLNTDVILTQGAVSKLIDFMDIDKKAGLCSPDLLKEDGKRQETGITFPSLLTELFGRIDLRETNIPYRTDAVRGACMMARTDIVKKIGGFNEKYFLFLEETDLCMRFKKEGYEIWVVPDAKVYHTGGKSAEGLEIDSRIEYWRSRYIFFRENYPVSVSIILHIGLAVKLLLNITSNLLVSCLVLFLNKKYRQKVKTYLKIFAWHILGMPGDWGIGSGNCVSADEWIIRREFFDWWKENKSTLIKSGRDTKPVKENLSRKLFIYNDEVYTKIYKKKHILKKPWINEWKTINRIRQLDVETVTPAAVGRGYLITKKLDVVQSLHDFFLEKKDRLKIKEKRDLIKELALFINKLHKKGVYHKDLHAGNILLKEENGEYKFYIIDLHRAKLTTWLTKKEIINNLVELHKLFSLYLSSADRLRFFKYYVKGMPLEVGFKKYAKLISEKTKYACFSLWEKRDKLYLKKNKYGIRGHCGGTRYILNPDYKGIDIKNIVDCIEGRKGDVIKDSKSSFVSRLEIGKTGRVIIKIYKQKKFVNYIKDIFRKSRGYKAWCGSWAVITRGIKTPEPVMAGEKRIFGIVKESFIITKEIQDSINLTLFAKNKNEEQCIIVSKKMSTYARVLHDRGIFPLDMKGSNVVVSENRGGLEIYLIDLDHMKLKRNIPLNKRLYNLLQIKKSTGLLCTDSLPVKKILIVKPSAFGDIIQSLSAAGMLKGQFKGASIWWLANKSYIGLLKLVPGIDRTIAFERVKWGKITRIFTTIPEILLFFIRIRRKRFDVVLDLQGLFRSGVITDISKAPIRMGFGNARDFAYLFYNYKVFPNSLHAKERYIEAAEFLAEKKEIKQEIIIPQNINNWADNIWGDKTKLRVAVNPGGRWKTKRWPAEKYANLINEISARYPVSRLKNIVSKAAKIILLGDINDKPAAQSVIYKTKADIIDLSGKTNLLELTALLKGADLLITNDSGTMHLADYLGIPIVALFGPTDPKRTGPKGKDVRIIKADIPCSPCFKRECEENKCMESISEEMVLAVVEEVLKKHKAVV
jgi:heptosyltransferase-1